METIAINIRQKTLTALSILLLTLIGVMVLVTAGCKGKTTTQPPRPNGTNTKQAKPKTKKQTQPINQQKTNKETTKMQITSNAFTANTTIPKRYTGEGEDISPELNFSGIPDNTKELALIMDDPDAPRPTPWVHWVIYNIAPSTTTLPENIARTAQPKQLPGAMQGQNSWPSDNIGYRGPMPPVGHGLHHYHFRLYALDTQLNLQPGLTKDELLAAMQGHIIEQTELVGTYQR